MKNGKRRGEEEGRQLTPGERAINWAKAFAVIIPLFGAGWVSNSDTVKGWVKQEVQQEVDAHEEEAVVEPVACPEPKIIERTIIKEAACNVDAAILTHEGKLHN